METWKDEQLRKFVNFNKWLDKQIQQSKMCLDRCGCGQRDDRIGVFEDRILLLKRIKGSLPKEILYKNMS